MHHHQAPQKNRTRRDRGFHPVRSASALASALAACLLATSCSGGDARSAQRQQLEDELQHHRQLLEDAKTAASEADESRDAAIAKQVAAEEKLRAQKDQPEVLDAEIAALNRRLDQLASEFKEYRIKYKQSVRKFAVGMGFPSLELGPELAFENVRISSLDPERVGIATAGGIQSVPLADLPTGIAWKLGYDPEGESLPKKPSTVRELTLEIEELVQARKDEKQRFEDMLDQRRQLLDEELRLQKQDLPVPPGIREEVARLETALTGSNTKSAEIIREMNKRIIAINNRQD